MSPAPSPPSPLPPPVHTAEKLLSVPHASPPIDTYAAAARALTTAAHSVETRLATIDALLLASPRLAPGPRPLIAQHALYALCHGGELPADVRARYWAVLRRVGGGTGAGIKDAALRGLGGDEASEVLLFLGQTRFGGGVEARAEVVSAVFRASSAGGAWESVARKVLEEWAEAQARCASAKRVCQAVVRYILPVMVLEGEWAGDRGGLWAEMWRVAVKGLFASPAAALERGGYFSGIYAWLATEDVRPVLGKALRALLHAFVAVVRTDAFAAGDGSRAKTSSRKRKKSEEDGGGGGKDDGIGVLPRQILVPLIFFKDLLRTTTACCLSEASSSAAGKGDARLRYAPLRAIGDIFGAAQEAGIYRSSYDERPAVRAKRKLAGGHSPSGDREKQAVKKKKECAAKEDGKITLESKKSSKPEPGLPDFGEALCVGDDIVAAFNAAILALEAASKDGCDTFAATAACSAILAAVALSLDTVSSQMGAALRAVSSLSSTGAGEEVILSASKVFATILTTYASTRQLPEAAMVLHACGTGFGPVLSSRVVRDAVTAAFSLAPRGHPQSFVRGLFVNNSQNPALVEAFVLLSCIVVESSPKSELQGLCCALVDTVVPHLRQELRDDTDFSTLLLHIQTSVLFAMAVSGTPITSPDVKRLLFHSHLAAPGDGGESSPDSDSSDYDAFIERRRRRETPRARFAELLATGVRWKRTYSVTREAKLSSPSEKHKRPAPAAVLPSLTSAQVLPYLRFLASLAHLCASDPLLMSSRNKDHDSDAMDVGDDDDDKAGVPSLAVVSALKLSLQECWTLFAALDRAESISTRLVNIGGSLVRLVKNDRVCRPVGSGGVDHVALGFKRFVGLALDGGKSLDTLWRELWESPSVRFVLAEVLKDLLSVGSCRLSISRILNRCALMPPRYLGNAEDLELVASCAEVIDAKADDDAASKAVTVLSKRRELPVDAGKHCKSPFLGVVETPLISGSGTGGEMFIVVLLRGHAWQARDSCRKRRLKLVVRLAGLSSSSLNRMTWFVRGARLALDDDGVSSESMSVLLREVISLTNSVQLLAGDGNEPGSSIESESHLACALCDLCLSLRNSNDRVDASVARSGDLDAIRKPAAFLSTRVLQFGKKSPPSSIPTITEFLATFAKGGRRGCSFILFPDKAESIFLRLATLCITWLKSDSLAMTEAGESVLSSLMMGEGSLLPAAASVSEFIEKELSEGSAHASSMVTAARILLCNQAGNSALVVGSLTCAVDLLRFETATVQNSAPSIVAHEAVTGAEAWSRAQIGRGGKWEAELILQLLCQACKSPLMSASTTVVALRICHVMIKQSSRSAASGPAAHPQGTAPGILWAVQRIVATVLQQTLRLDLATMTEASRVQEAVSSVCSSSRSRSSSSSPSAVVVLMTADLANCLTGVKSAAVRGAASAGMSSLLTACGGDDVVAAAMTMLKTDTAKEILRAVRAEVVEDGAVYRGRA